MKTIIDVAMGANGSPSEVKARIADQVQALALKPEQAPIAAAINAFVAEKLSGASEDDTLSVQANVVIVLADAPATVTAKRQAEREAHELEVRSVTNELADAKKKVAELESTIATLKDTPATLAQQG